MWPMIESLPDQYRWASNLDAPAVVPASSILVCGMGGSGISGDFVQAAVADVQVDVRIHKDYGLPAWAASVRPLVIAVSYSGDTAETLSSLQDAIGLGLPVAVVSTGGVAIGTAVELDLPHILVPPGLQPRAALGYLAGAVFRLVGNSAGLSHVKTTLEEAADLLEWMLADAETRGRAHEIASDLSGRLPIVWGSRGPAEVAAQRWAKQMHENAKTPAYWSTIPELDHNELVGWAASQHGFGRATGIVLLRDKDERPEISQRFTLTSELLSGDSFVAGEVWSHGESPLARSASLGLVGDLVSVFAAEAAGVDPVPVDVLTELKKRLEGKNDGI